MLGYLTISEGEPPQKEDKLTSDSSAIFFPFFGPTPWGCRNKSFVAEGITYLFRDVAPEDGNLAGITSLQDSDSATWILFDFHCCIAVLNNGGITLANHANTDNPNKITCAIFVFDWKKRQVQVLPQDWFNQGNYDFGYQWITRVARRIDGSIIGDGIRLGIFELDSTNRQVNKWLEENPFYMI